MSYSEPYRQGVIAWPLKPLDGWQLLNFGTNWCGHCQAAQAPLVEALKAFPQLPHIKEEDGRRRPVGRHFHVKLWPTLILLHDGSEVARLVRPTTVMEINDMLEAITQKG